VLQRIKAETGGVSLLIWLRIERTKTGVFPVPAFA